MSPKGNTVKTFNPSSFLLAGGLLSLSLLSGACSIQSPEERSAKMSKSRAASLAQAEAAKNTVLGISDDFIQQALTHKIEAAVVAFLDGEESKLLATEENAVSSAHQDLQDRGFAQVVRPEVAVINTSADQCFHTFEVTTVYENQQGEKEEQKITVDCSCQLVDNRIQGYTLRLAE